MIFGVGIDTVSITRMDNLLKARGEKFLRRVFSDLEIAEGMKRARPSHFFAARFAAREAFVKALGTGFRKGVALRDIGVTRGEIGKPELVFSPRGEALLLARGITKCHLSITHEGDSAQAVVILEGNQGVSLRKGEDR